MAEKNGEALNVGLGLHVIRTPWPAGADRLGITPILLLPWSLLRTK